LIVTGGPLVEKTIMGIVRIHRDVATIDDLLAHADLLAEMAATEEQFSYAAKMRKAAEVALARAGGDRTVLLRDVRDQRLN
jgi:hypothetical protein